MVSTCRDQIKYFKFLNCWVDNPQFMETVITCSEKEVAVTGKWKFHQKLKDCQIFLVVGLRMNLVIFYKRLGCMKNKYKMLKKTTSLTNVTQIEVSSMK